MPTRPSKRLQIVFLATGAFAVPSMRALCDCGEFDVLGLVTNPQRIDKTGRPIVTPARKFAEEYDITISEKEDVHSQEFYDFLWLMRPDLLFVCDFGHILKKRVIDAALLGGVNLHGSLLPKYRGAAPVHWAILNGERYTGVSVIHMTPQVDAGPVIAQSPPIPISPFDTVEDVESRLAEYGAELVLHSVRKMATNEQVKIIEQIGGVASKAPKLKKHDGLIEWNWTATGIFNHYRAMAQWPKSYTDWTRSDGTRTRLILGKVIPLDDSFRETIDDDFSDPAFVPPILIDAKMDNLAVLRSRWQANPGCNGSPKAKKGAKTLNRPDWWQPSVVVKAENDQLIVAAGEGTVRIMEVQPAGKKMMNVHDFLRGYPIRQGDRFGLSGAK